MANGQSRIYTYELFKKNSIPAQFKGLREHARVGVNHLVTTGRLINMPKNKKNPLSWTFSFFSFGQLCSSKNAFDRCPWCDLLAQNDP